MQADKPLISQCRQGKLAPVIAVTPNETSEGFPASDPHPVRPYPDFNCTRSGCSLFSCAGVEVAATSSGHTPHRYDRHTRSRGLCRAQPSYPHGHHLSGVLAHHRGLAAAMGFEIRCCYGNE